MVKNPYSLFDRIRRDLAWQHQSRWDGESPRGDRPEKRRVPYVDFAVQFYLLLGLVALEVVLLIGGIVVLFHRLRGVIDESLYRAHSVSHEALLPRLLEETGWVIGGMLLVNILALLAADRIWVVYVRSITRTFSELAKKTGNLEFVEDPDLGHRHRVIDLMVAWRRSERERARGIRQNLANIDPSGEFHDEKINAIYRRRLQAVRRLLPPYSRRYVGRIRDASSS
ncbi:MAG: hypothetical protein HQL59_02465 [Magnetococcales bacterium]|nr:hypothetical protein [Magnetococcales bacterium]